ncbi:MAG: hypothetical protein DCC55_32285 [Chloroflexi bacterium]|nr:MAG: hypothetical protein DCC55_32285 [Chloroflexota bacterium]
MFRFAIVTIIVLFVISANQVAVVAQPSARWSPDAQAEGYLENTFTPYLLADQNHTVHAFASQLVSEDDEQFAIVYAQWRLESSWSKPIDVLLGPDGGDAQPYGAFLDASGVIHLAFWGGEALDASVYYSQAPAANAGRARAWSSPTLVGEDAHVISSGSFAGDDKGNLIIVYNGNGSGNGIYAVQSSDAGASWSESIPVFLTYDEDLTPFSLRTYLDQEGQLHAVWNVVTDKGVDEALYYARLDIAQQQWSIPLLLDERIDRPDFFGPSFPAIAGYGSIVVVMYNSGNPFGGPVAAGRPVQMVRLSDDGGLTWEDPISPFPRHLGRSGEHALVVDSNQVIHAVFMQRIETTVDGKPSVIDGPWHSELRGRQWSEPVRFPTTWSPHDMRAVVSQGNVLLAVWREDPGAGQHGVWYSYAIVNAPELPVIPIPTIAATPTSVREPTATPAQLAVTPSPTQLVRMQGDVTPTTQRNPAGPLIFAAAPVFLLCALLILVRQWSRYRNR